MTLKDHFALKSVFVSVSDRLACSGFQTKMFANLQSYTRIYCQRLRATTKCIATALVCQPSRISCLTINVNVRLLCWRRFCVRERQLQPNKHDLVSCCTSAIYNYFHLNCEISGEGTRHLTEPSKIRACRISACPQALGKCNGRYSDRCESVVTGRSFHLPSSIAFFIISVVAAKIWYLKNVRFY